MTYEKLFEKYKVNDKLILQNRVVMAPLTRCFADENNVPTDLMAEYYGRRGDSGLIIAEATLVSKLAQGYPNQPGIFNQAQMSAWEKINHKVHENGAKIFCQIFHSGRISHETYHEQQPIAPSSIGYDGRIPRTELNYETPRALETKEVKEVVTEFIQAAINSVNAGFDGVEIHAANGYLTDQFLHQETNQRTDEYGGSTENRARFTLEIIDGIIASIGKEKVGIRISPHAYLHLGHTSGDEETFKYLLKEIEKRDISYVHTGTFDDHTKVDYLNGKVSEFIRANYKGTVIANGSYEANEGNQLLKDEKFDLFAIGRPFISNPDLITKLKTNAVLTQYDENMLGELV